jgi:hypothetical protein
MRAPTLRERKAFFFEKKKQKTFGSFGFGFTGWSELQFTKVFCCFFSKKKALLPTGIRHAATAGGQGCDGQSPVRC